MMMIILQTDIDDDEDEDDDGDDDDNDKIDLDCYDFAHDSGHGTQHDIIIHTLQLLKESFPTTKNSYDGVL